MLCGYAVEWLRSCYSGNWRLYANAPLTLSPGYFWFCDPATPFYPGPHNYYSRVWTTPELIDPPLGEASGKQLYFKGQLPVAAPPAVAVGTPDCFANGDQLGDVSPGPVPGGIDARCYPAGQAPDPSPALWLVASDLAGTSVGGTVPFWQDRSVYRRDVSTTPQLTPPLFDTSVFATGAVAFSGAVGLNLPFTLTLRNDFAVFAIAAYLGSPINGGFGILARGAHLITGPFVWVPGQIRATAQPGGLSFPISPNPIGVPFLYVCRRVSGVCHLRINGVEKGFGLLPPQSVFPCITVAGLTIPAAGLAGLQVAEVLAYDQPLSDAGFAQIEADLLAGLPI